MSTVYEDAIHCYRANGLSYLMAADQFDLGLAEDDDVYAYCFCKATRSESTSRLTAPATHHGSKVYIGKLATIPDLYVMVNGVGSYQSFRRPEAFRGLPDNRIRSAHYYAAIAKGMVARGETYAVVLKGGNVMPLRGGETVEPLDTFVKEITITHAPGASFPGGGNWEW